MLLTNKKACSDVIRACA